MNGSLETAAASPLAGARDDPRHRAVGAASALVAAGALGMAPFASVSARLAGVALLAGLAFASARMRIRLAFTSALLFAVALAAWSVPPIARLWPAPLLVALAVAGVVARARRDAGAFGWLRRGAFTPSIAAWTGATAVVSGAALLLWYALLRPSLDRLVFPPAPLWATVALALAWSVLNAFAEEAMFRGALLEALRVSMRNGTAALVVQALAFGFMHLRGVPRGWAGVGLASIYGLMLGALRLRAGGLLAPIVAHVFADVVIMAILLVLAR